MNKTTRDLQAREPREKIAAGLSAPLLLLLGAVIILTAGGFLFADQVSPAANCVGEGPCMLYFYTSSCPVCKQMAPVVDRLEQRYASHLRIVRLNSDSRYEQRLAREYGVIGHPTFIFLDRSGEEGRRLMGAHTAETFEREIERIVARPKE